MYVTADQLKAALRALDAARQTFDCQAPRRDAAGHDGYGTHGSAFIGVNMATGDVNCLACSGQIDHVARPKVAVKKGRRVHRVSQ